MAPIYIGSQVMRWNQLNNRMLRCKTGYTLLEMAIAVSIMGLFSVMAAPSLHRTIQDLRFRRSAEEVVGILKTIRAEAVTRQRSMHVALNPVAQQFYVGWDQNGDGVIGASEWNPIASNLPAGLLRSNQLPNGRFNSRGMFHAPVSFWELELMGPLAQKRYVYVFPSGHIALTEERLPQ